MSAAPAARPPFLTETERLIFEAGCVALKMAILAGLRDGQSGAILLHCGLDGKNLRGAKVVHATEKLVTAVGVVVARTALRA